MCVCVRRVGRLSLCVRVAVGGPARPRRAVCSLRSKQILRVCGRGRLCLCDCVPTVSHARRDRRACVCESECRYFFCDFLWLFSFVHTVRRTLLTGKRDPVPRPIRASGCDGRVYLILNSLGTELFTFERKSGRNAPRTLDGARRRHAPTAHGAAEWPVAVRRTPKCKDRR
jgi:hypothetical protein